MAIPEKAAPFPQTLRKTFSVGTGAFTNLAASIKVTPSQGSAGSPVSQVNLVCQGVGSLSVPAASYIGSSKITVAVPLTGIPTPFNPQSQLQFTAGAPTIQLPAGLSLSSFSVQPCVKSNLGGLSLLPVTTLNTSQKINQFFVQVTLQLSAAIPSETTGSIVIGVSASITS